MTSRSPVIRMSEFDVTQRIIEAVSSVSTRAILFSVLHQAKDANHIAMELQLSVSTVYKALTHLENLALIVVERYSLDDGKKIKMYRSRIGRVEINMTGTEPILNLYPNIKDQKA